MSTNYKDKMLIARWCACEESLCVYILYILFLFFCCCCCCCCSVLGCGVAVRRHTYTNAPTYFKSSEKRYCLSVDAYSLVTYSYATHTHRQTLTCACTYIGIDCGAAYGTE